MNDEQQQQQQPNPKPINSSPVNPAPKAIPSIQHQLHTAVRYGKIKQVKAILAEQEKCRQNDDSTNDLLISLLNNMSLEDPRKNNGKTGNNHNHNHHTMLLLAAANGHWRICRLLIEKGADQWLHGNAIVNGIKFANIIPFAAAACAGHLKICQILLSAAKNASSSSAMDQLVNWQFSVPKQTNGNNGCDNLTALMVAAFWKNLNVVQLLLQNEADVEKMDSNSMTALHYAFSGGDAQIVDELRNKTSILELTYSNVAFLLPPPKPSKEKVKHPKKPRIIKMPIRRIAPIRRWARRSRPRRKFPNYNAGNTVDEEEYWRLTTPTRRRPFHSEQHLYRKSFGVMRDDTKTFCWIPTRSKKGRKRSWPIYGLWHDSKMEKRKWCNGNQQMDLEEGKELAHISI